MCLILRLPGADLPIFKFELEKSAGRVIDGSYGKEATVEQLPISKGLAGVSMLLQPGVMRELHWHATAAEWAYIVKGNVRTTVIDPYGCAETNDFGPGDIWYFLRGHGHVIQTLGHNPCHFILVFDNGYFSEFGTFSITDWVGHAPKRLLAKNFGLPETVSAAWKTKPSWGIVAGDDKIINPELERWYYVRAHSHTAEVKGASHSVYESHPKEVAAVIADAARTIQSANAQK